MKRIILVALAAISLPLYANMNEDYKIAKNQKLMDLRKQFTAAGVEMIQIPHREYEISKTEITQDLYVSVMGSNPSKIRTDDLPVENVSWYDAVCFCNRLSEKFGLEPVYKVDGETNVAKWGYVPHQGLSVIGKVTVVSGANGFKLPTSKEWFYAAKAESDFEYAGSDDVNEVCWMVTNSQRPQTVAAKKPNAFGLYDMSGNVAEWCWNTVSKEEHYICGGGWRDSTARCTVESYEYLAAYVQHPDLGFRVVRNTL